MQSEHGPPLPGPCSKHFLQSADRNSPDRTMFWKLSYLLLLTVAFEAYLSLASQWPYLQIYPPVNETDGRMPLYFAVVLSFGGAYRSIGALPGVQIALDYINSEPSILSGYSLHYTLADSQVA